MLEDKNVVRCHQTRYVTSYNIKIDCIICVQKVAAAKEIYPPEEIIFLDINFFTDFMRLMKNGNFLLSM